MYPSKKKWAHSTSHKNRITHILVHETNKSFTVKKKKKWVNINFIKLFLTYVLRK